MGSKLWGLQRLDIYHLSYLFDFTLIVSVVIYKIRESGTIEPSLGFMHVAVLLFCVAKIWNMAPKDYYEPMLYL